MGKTRHEIQPKVDAQRRAIREHIEKYKNYAYEQDKRFALDTISRCQSNIADLKRQCNVSIDDSWEDYWTP